MSCFLLTFIKLKEMVSGFPSPKLEELSNQDSLLYEDLLFVLSADGDLLSLKWEVLANLWFWGLV